MELQEIIAFIYLGVIVVVLFGLLIWCIKLDDKQKMKRLENEKKRNDLLFDINEKLYIMISKEKE